MQLQSILPVVIALILLIAIFAYAGIRIGPSFLIKRLAGLVFVILGVTFVTFILGYLAPADAVYGLCQPRCTPHTIAALQHFYHLDLPWYEQYGNFLNNLVHGSLGDSYTARGRAVWSIVGQALPVSLQLGLPAITLQILIGVPVGVLAAIRAGSRYDTTTMAGALIFYSLPTFIVIPVYQLVIVFLALHNLPHLPLSNWGDPIHMIAPIIVLTLVGMGFYARLTRTTMLDVLHQDYVRTARAKGLRERTVIVRHAFRNALVPLVTAIGPAVAFVVAGAFFTETLFNIPGIGYWAVQSIAAGDMPVVQATVLLVAIAVAVMNLIVDVTYGLLDPRIKVA